MERQGLLGNATFLVVFLIVFGLNLYIFGPMFHALAFAAILAGSFYPLHTYLAQNSNWRPEYTALLSCVIILVVLVLPLVYMGFHLFREAISLYDYLREGIAEGWWNSYFKSEGLIGRLFTALGLPIDTAELSELLLEKARLASGELVSTLNSLVGDILNFLFQFILMFMAIFAFFLKGPQLKAIFLKMSPLPDSEEELILRKFNQMNYVTLICNGLGGVLQGALAGIGFWAMGIQSVFLWTAVMMVLAFIPLVGISFVTIPASLYLYASGSPTKAIILLTYSTVVALVVENWFKPYFIGMRVKINSLLLLFYIVAGMQTFGAAGIFYGPILCIIFLTLSDIFLKNYLPLWLRGKMPH